MNTTFRLFTGLIAFFFLSPAAAAQKSYPAKNPVLSYDVPENWKSGVESKDGSISINSEDGRISANFAEVPREATMELFEKMLPAMAKVLKEPAIEQKPTERTVDGLTVFMCTYTGKIEDKPAKSMFVLIKAGKGRAILGNIIVGDPETLPKEDGEAYEKFMKSMKGAAGLETSFPTKDPVLRYVAPAKWKTDVDPKDGSISINSEDERISVNFAETASEATLVAFEGMLPEMVKDLKEAAVAQKPREHTEDGLSGFTCTYTGKIEDKAVLCMFVLFKAGKDRAVVGNMILSDPQTLPKEDSVVFDIFMKSLKGAAR